MYMSPLLCSLLREPVDRNPCSERVFQKCASPVAVTENLFGKRRHESRRGQLQRRESVTVIVMTADTAAAAAAKTSLFKICTFLVSLICHCVRKELLVMQCCKIVTPNRKH
jgi:hypothetical protein